MANIGRSLVAVFTAAAFAACSAGGSVAPPTGQVGDHDNGTRHTKGKLVLHVHVPRKKHTHRGPRYVSSATKAMTIAIGGLTDVNMPVGLTPSATGCTSSLTGTFCTLTISGLTACPTSANCYAATIA